MPVNDKISKVDFNSIRNKLANVIGEGSGNSGWGQTVVSSLVDESNKVGVNDWGKLRYDIINAYRHIYGSNPSIYEAIINQLVRHDSDTTSFVGSSSGTTLRVYSVSSGMLSIGQIVSGAGIVGSPTITGFLPQVSSTITGISSKTGSSPGPYSVTYTFSTEPAAPQIGINYIVSGHSNLLYNGIFKATASTTTSITLTYPSDPERTVTSNYRSNGSSGTTVVVDNAENIIEGQIITGTGFSSSQTVVSKQTQTFYTTNSGILSGVLTIGKIISGTVYPGMVISGDNIPANTIITSNVSGTGEGSTWNVSSSLVNVPNAEINGTRDIIITSSPPTVTPSGTLTFKLGNSITSASFKAEKDENPWGRGSWQLSTSQSLGATSLSAAKSTEFPTAQYNTFADTIVNNRFTVHNTQSSTRAWPEMSRTWNGSTSPQYWTTRIQSIVTATWPTAEAARKFFNSGGRIRFSSSRSGATTPAQNKSWTDLLATTASSPFEFGGAFPGTGTSPMDAKNYFRCTNGFQPVTSITASTPYGSNRFQLQARTPYVGNNSTGTASVVEFMVEWIDTYVDPGNSPWDVPNTIDRVDGTFALNVSHLYAVFTLDPPGTAVYTIEQPTISVSSITGS